MARFKTVRASEPNAGVRAQAKKRLKTITRAFSRMVREDMLFFLLKDELPAMDASLSNPLRQDEETRRRMAAVAAVIRAHERQLRSVDIRRLDAYVQERLPAWLYAVDAEARAFAKWFARSLLSTTTASQRAALKAAGFTPNFMRRRWTVPVGRQYVSPQAAAALPEIVETATNLITRISERAVTQLQDTIVAGVESGQDIGAIQRVLATVGERTENRAELTAIDQVNKVSNAIAIANSQALGMTEGVWVHVPGKYTSRETHRDMNGKRFDLSVGLWDEGVQKNVLPGECPFCRCYYRSVIPKEIMDAMNDE